MSIVICFLLVLMDCFYTYLKWLTCEFIGGIWNGLSLNWYHCVCFRSLHYHSNWSFWKVTIKCLFDNSFLACLFFEAKKWRYYDHHRSAFLAVLLALSSFSAYRNFKASIDNIIDQCNKKNRGKFVFFPLKPLEFLVIIYVRSWFNLELERQNLLWSNTVK